MKKFVLILCCLLAVFFLVVCILIFVPLPDLERFTAPKPYEKAPKVYYHVVEGAVEVFSFRDNRVGSLLSLVRPGETYVVKPVPKAALKIPFWMEWLEPVTVAAVQRANLYMYKESQKAHYREFAVGYTDETIQRGFVREIENSGVISNVQIHFHADGFSLSGQVKFVPISVRGYASTQGTSNHLYLRLRWVKIGGTFLPEHILRMLENIFAKAYFESGHASIKLLRINFSDKTMIMYYRKESDFNSHLSQRRNLASEEEIFWPSGNY